MSIICFGLSHHSMPLSILESYSFDSESMEAFLEELRDDECIREAVGISTCNRTEFYLEAPDADGAREQLLERLADRTNSEHSILIEHG